MSSRKGVQAAGLAATACIAVLTAALVPSGTAEIQDALMPSWTSLRIDLTEGDAEVNITGHVRCSSEAGCFLAMASFDAHANWALAIGYVTPDGVFVETDGIAPLPRLRQEITSPLQGEPEFVELGLTANRSLAQSSSGDWWAMFVLLDSTAAHDLTISVNPSTRIAALHHGQQTNAVWWRNLDPALHAEATPFARAGVEYRTSFQTSQGFLGVFDPHDLHSSVTVAARLHGPGGVGAYCQAGAVLVVGFCVNDSWAGFGPPGVWRINAFLSAEVARNWPVLIWADGPPVW